MARIVCQGIVSLDGYLNDGDGRYDWAYTEEIGDFLNAEERQVGTYLLGRRMYEELAIWDTYEPGPDEPASVRGYQDRWHQIDKVVYSRSLGDVKTARTRLERDFDPAAARQLADAADLDVAVSGATLAAEAFRAGIVDETSVYLLPRTVGGGTPFFPPDLRVELELVEHKVFPGGTVYLRHRVVR